MFLSVKSIPGADGGGGGGGDISGRNYLREVNLSKVTLET